MIRKFDSRHQVFGNKEYADLLWKVLHCCTLYMSSNVVLQRLESSTHHNTSVQGRLLFHVTVFNLEEQDNSYGVKTNQRLLWEVHNKHIDGR